MDVVLLEVVFVVVPLVVVPFVVVPLPPLDPLLVVPGTGVAVPVGVGVAVGTVVGVAVGVAVGIIALTALYAFNLPPLITLPVSAESLSELEHKVSLISFAEIFGFTARITATALATIGVAIEVPDIVP